uniref:Uncharacterized protein n=1 Tax=Leersia perrieri TaxID=77586 RepID=A0A0D9V6L3_9ORYZ
MPPRGKTTPAGVTIAGPVGRAYARKLPTLPCVGSPVKLRSHRHPKPTTRSTYAGASSLVDHQEETPRSSTRSKSIRTVGLEGKRVIEKDGSPLPLTSPSDVAILPQENKSLDLSLPKGHEHPPYGATAVSASDRDHVTTSPWIPVRIAVALPSSAPPRRPIRTGPSLGWGGLLVGRFLQAGCKTLAVAVNITMPTNIGEADPKASTSNPP